MSTVQPTDKVLVQRATTLHSAPADMSTVQDTDLILVNRAGVDYKCSVADWKASQSKPPAIASVTLADSPEAGRFTSGTFRSTVVMTDEGVPASTKGIKAYVEGTLKSVAMTSAITKVGIAASATTYQMAAGTASNTWADVSAGAVTQAIGTAPSSNPSGKGLYFHVTGGSYVVGEAGNGNPTWGGGNTKVQVSNDGITYSDFYTPPSGTPGINIVPAISAPYARIIALGTDLLQGSYFYAHVKTATALTFTDSTNLSNFAPGDAITEVTAAGAAGDATGTVGAVDAVAKTITLASTAGTWDVGSAVKGPLKTQTVTTTPNSDEIVAVGGTAAAPILTFKTDKDLAKFAAGDAVTQENSAPQSSTTYTYAHVATGGSAGVRDMRSDYAANTALGTVGVPDTAAKGIIWDAVSKAGTFSMSVATSAGALFGSDDLVNWAAAGTINTGANSFTGHRYYWLDSTPSGYTSVTVRSANLIQPAGTVGSVNTTAKTMTLATSTGTWGPANAGHYVIGPTKTGPAANVKLYCKLNAGLTVTDLQSADPGYTTVTGAGPYTVTFPATLPSGNPPDTDLPAGTHLVTEVQASNSRATVHKASNTVVPA